jgi:acetyl esterase/lipase
MKHITAVLFSIFLAGCTEAGVFVANLPVGFDSVTRHADLSYGDDSLQKLDVYVPAQASKTQALPVLVFFYGGDWTMGQKEMYRFVGSRFAKAGYIVVIPDYRKYPQVKYPAFVEDAAQSVKWVHDNISRYHGTPERIYLVGHSAGAHSAAMLAADERFLQNASVPYSSIQAFAGLAGPYHFTPEEEKYKKIFGPSETYDHMKVTTFINGDEPPMLLLYGLEDDIVHIRNLQKLEAAIQQVGGKVETKLYPDANHIGMVAAISWIPGFGAPVTEDVLAFFEKQAKTFP